MPKTLTSSILRNVKFSHAFSLSSFKDFDAYNFFPQVQSTLFNLVHLHYVENFAFGLCSVDFVRDFVELILCGFSISKI